jgi:hypothetical protein
MAANYASLFMVYCCLFLYFRWKSS